MSGLIKYFIDRPLLVNLISVGIIIMGIILLPNIKRELFPRIEFNFVVVNSYYQGASAEDVEALVTISLERELKNVEGIKKINAISKEERSIITLEVDPYYKFNEVYDDIKDAVNSVSDLPEKPIISRIRHNSILARVALYGEDYDLLKKASDNLERELERSKYIASISKSGYRENEIHIVIDLEQMNKYEVTAGEIVSALKVQNFNLPAGLLKSTDSNIVLRSISKFKGVDDIKNTIIRSNNSGKHIRIFDVAEVKRTSAEETSLSRFNGKPAIFLSLSLNSKADIIKSKRDISKIVDNFFKSHQEYKQVKHDYVDDASYFVTRRLNILKDNSILSIILVFLTLLVFLNLRTSILTSISIPIAFMISFISMAMFDISINLLSMFSLIMVLGMLVDDAIIVAEQFYKHVNDGKNNRDAAILAAEETIKPISTTIITTIIAFSSIFFMGGTMGKFIWHIPTLIIICLVASYLECFFILPSHLAEFYKKDKKQKPRRIYNFFLKSYQKVLSRVISRAGVVTASFGIVLIASLFIAKTMKFELFPGDDVRTLIVKFKGKVGIKLEKTRNVVEVMEKKIQNTLTNKELKNIRSIVGALSVRNSMRSGSHYATTVVYLTPPGERKRKTDLIVKDIMSGTKELFPDFDVFITKVQGGPPKGEDINVELFSDSVDDLKAASKEVLLLLQKQKGVNSAEIDFEQGKKQLAIRVNDIESRRLGLNPRQVAIELKNVFSGAEITEIRESRDDIDIRVYLDDKFRGDPDTINKLYILNRRGRRIPINKVVEAKEEDVAFIIRRLNQRIVFSVTASINKKIVTSVGLVRKIRGNIDNIIKKFSGMEVNFGGENEDTSESMSQLLKAGIISLISIFFVLVIMFGNFLHPFIIMMAIPLGLVGVILVFKVTGLALSFISLLGVIGLIGVVVNDSIILVSFINNRVKNFPKLPLYENIVLASTGRFKPVILTTFTTVVGLLPIAHPTIAKILTFGVNKDFDPFLKPMAMSICWGLLISSLVTLFFIPCCYYSLERIVNFIKGKCFARK